MQLNSADDCRPFANAVKAGVGAIMSSYNQINNSYSSQNSYTLNHLLKHELGYQVIIHGRFLLEKNKLLMLSRASSCPTGAVITQVSAPF